MAIRHLLPRWLLAALTILLSFAALDSLPSPLNRGVWAVLVFLALPYIFPKPRLTLYRPVVVLGAAGAFVAGLLYGETGFTWPERVLVIAGFLGVVAMAFIDRRRKASVN